MEIGRLDLAQAARDQQETVSALRHPSKPLRENGPVGGTGMHQIWQFLPLHYTDLVWSKNSSAPQNVFKMQGYGPDIIFDVHASSVMARPGMRLKSR